MDFNTPTPVFFTGKDFELKHSLKTGCVQVAKLISKMLLEASAAVSTGLQTNFYNDK